MTVKREETPKATLLIVYMIGFCFLWEQCKRISFPGSSEIVPWMRVGMLILLGAVLFRLPYREHRWYFILIAGVILIIATSWIRSPSALSKTKSNFSQIILVLLLCPAIGILAQGYSRKTFLQVLTAVWTITYVILCIVGIYAAIQGIQIMSYNGKHMIGINQFHRLLLWDSSSNTTGTLLALSIMVAYIGAAISGKKWISALYLIAVIPMLICLTLTSSRAGMISMWIGSGIALAVILQKPLGRFVHMKWLRWLISLVLIIAVVFLGLTGLEKLKRDYNSKVLYGGSLVSSAKAETTETPEAETAEEEATYIPGRDYFDGTLTGREELWRNALEALKKKPILLLTGTSIHTTMNDLAELVPTYDMPQLHNEILQILVSTGIFGLLLLIAFLYYVIRAAFRLFTDTERPLWERLLFLPFICIFLIDQVEALRITVHPDLLGLMMIFTGAAIVIAGHSRPEKADQAVISPSCSRRETPVT